jgi:hypothetical protein
VYDVHDLRLHGGDGQRRPRLVALDKRLVHLVALGPVVVNILWPVFR